MVERILKWGGYPLFFVFCFVLFSYWTFPYERLRDLAIVEGAKRGYEIEIIDVSPSWGTGVQLEGLRIVFPETDASKAPLDLTVEELTVHPSIIGLIAGNRAFSFDAELGGGSADGDVEIGEEHSEFDIELDEIDLKSIPALRRFTKVPLSGIASGIIDLELPKKVDESTGEVDLSITELRVGDGKTKVDIPGWGGLTVDEADMGNLELKAEVTEGVAKITKGQSHGTDLRLDVGGSVRLAQPLGRSQLDLMARVKIEEAYKKKSTKIASVLDLAGSRPAFKAAQTSDGFLQYEIKGSMLGRLRPRPAGNKPFAEAN